MLVYDNYALNRVDSVSFQFSFEISLIHISNFKKYCSVGEIGLIRSRLLAILL